MVTNIRAKGSRILARKIGRNEPCPCGSGKKYKRCCGNTLAQQQQVRIIQPEEIPPEVRHAIAEHQRKEAERLRRFGHVRPIISTEHQGHKLVAVGGTLHWSKKWKTFQDFLLDYVRQTLGGDWGNAELAKPFDERHPVIQWYHHVCMLQKRVVKEPGTVYSTTMTGPVKAYITLAYDLYTLRHHGLLQEKLVNRLKIKGLFQGARYETYVAAAFIRAGFDVAHENEDDGTTTHCEFVVIYRVTGLQYSVEAKSRHRPGLLGQPGTPQPVDQTEKEVMRLLKRALQKRADHPRIVFIDVNMPPNDGGPFAAPWFQSIGRRLRIMEARHSKTGTLPPAFLFFTNHPNHFVGVEDPEPGHTAIFTAVAIPDFGQNDPSIIVTKYPALQQLFDSVFHHTEIPHEFPE